MATSDNNLLLSENAFSKCAPNISTNIKQCGTVALCHAKPLLSTDLESVYTSSQEYRVMESLLMADMEIKMCEAQQNGLYDFLIANKVNLAKKVIVHGRDSGLLQIAPFIKARQHSPINNEWWNFADGEASGETNWLIGVSSAGNVPLDVRSFPTGISIYLNAEGDGGSILHGVGKVVSASINGEVIDLILSGLDRRDAPTGGYLTRGGNNVSDYEKECQEKPAYMTKKLVPFWVKTSRWSMCKSSAYDQYRALMLANNPLFREFGDVPDIERNRQLAAEFQKSWVQDFWWGKALEFQNMAEYGQLEDIETFDPTDASETESGIASPLGVDGPICVGKRAEPVGVYNQLLECDRVVDLLGGALNLPALFHAFYDIIRIRVTRGDNNKVIDVFTDTTTAHLINRAMIKYYSSESADHNDETTFRYTIDGAGYSVAKKADFGFLYRSYPLIWPAGVVMNVLTHYSFDDEISVADAKGIAGIARRLWVLDFTGIYPGIIASNRLVANTGDLKTLQSINSDFACVMKVHTRQQTLTSMTYTVIVDCPAGNLILENFSGAIPEIVEEEGLRYPTTTTTTTPGIG